MRAIHPPGQFDHNKIDPSLREGKYGRYNFDIGIIDKGTGSARARYNGFLIGKDDLMNTVGGLNYVLPSLQCTAQCLLSFRGSNPVVGEFLLLFGPPSLAVATFLFTLYQMHHCLVLRLVLGASA